MRRIIRNLGTDYNQVNKPRLDRSDIRVQFRDYCNNFFQNWEPEITPLVVRYFGPEPRSIDFKAERDLISQLMQEVANIEDIVNIISTFGAFMKDDFGIRQEIVNKLFSYMFIEYYLDKLGYTIVRPEWHRISDLPRGAQES